MFCERCGSEIAEINTVCPVCGTAIPREQPVNAQQPYTSYSHHGQPKFETYQQAYQDNRAQSGVPPWGNGPQNNYGPGYRAYTPSISPQGIAVSNKNENALIAEIILSLFGIFGVGWLMGGETVVGAILLACSIFIYWPFMIYGTIFTFGIGLICLGPLAISAIIVNILLLNSRLNRKANRFIVTPQPPYPMHPPQRHL